MMDINSDNNCEFCLIDDWNAKTSNMKDFIVLHRNIASYTGLDNDNNIFLSDEILNNLGTSLTWVNRDTKSDKAGVKLLDFC